MSTSAPAADGTVGFIGLGVMGLPMAANLARAHTGELVVWNRSPARVSELQAEFPGVRAARSAAEVVRSCDVTFTMLSTPAAVRAVFHDGPDAALDALQEGKSLVDCSTLTEADMQQTSARAQAQGARFLEAPVSGSLGPAKQGSLIFLCGGDKSLYDEVGWALDAMGKRSVYLGGVGAGTRMKLVVNQIMGATLCALAEGIALSEAAQLPVHELLSVLEIGATGNAMFSLKGPKMAAGARDYATNFPLEHALKDMRFARELGRAHRVAMPVAAAATEMYDAAARLGLSRDDFSAVIESVRARVVDAQPVE